MHLHRLVGACWLLHKGMKCKRMSLFEGNFQKWTLLQKGRREIKDTSSIRRRSMYDCITPQTIASSAASTISYLKIEWRVALFIQELYSGEQRRVMTSLKNLQASLSIFISWVKVDWSAAILLLVPCCQEGLKVFEERRQLSNCPVNLVRDKLVWQCW